MLRILFNGNEVAMVNTNHSMTLEEAIYIGLGIDVNSQEDCKKSYENGDEFAYLDDCGFYHIDTEAMDIEGVEV